jgi:hypothetical protein
MILIGLMNYKCHLKEFEKQQYNGLSKSSNLATISKLNKSFHIKICIIGHATLPCHVKKCLSYNCDVILMW